MIFFKAKGEIYAKIVPKNEIIINDEVKWESINGKLISNYDFYTKKLLFKKEDTLICNNSCYLLFNLKVENIAGIIITIMQH